MTLSDQIAALHARGKVFPILTQHNVLGISFTRHRGYLWIDDAGEEWVVWVVSGRRTHNPLEGNGFAVDIKKSDSSHRASYKTALSLWRVRNVEESKNVFIFVANRVRLVYDAMKLFEAGQNATQEQQQRNKAV